MTDHSQCFLVAPFGDKPVVCDLTECTDLFLSFLSTYLPQYWIYLKPLLVAEEENKREKSMYNLNKSWTEYAVAMQNISNQDQLWK